MQRIGGRVVGFGLLGIALAVTYCWCLRISDDLSWDEAASLKRYAHHPVVAASYLRDSNNHPLDSLARSIAFRVIGLDTPPFWRFAGFVVLLGFLAAAWRWWRHFTEAGSSFAATVVVLLLFLSHAVHEQALALRGYFPSIVLQAVYFLLVARRSRLHEPPAAGAAAPAMTPRLRAGLASLCALMLFLLPSNLVLMLVLWPATALAFAPRGGPGWVRTVVGESLRLGLLTGAFAIILYLPIFVTIAVGVTSIEHLRSLLPVYPVPSAVQAVVQEAAFVFQQVQPGRFVEKIDGERVAMVSAPGAMPDWLFAALVGALLVASATFRRRERGTRVAWCLLVSALVVCCTLAVLNATPARIKSPYVAPVLFALVFFAHDLGVRWTPRVQIAAALAALALGYATLPATIRATRFDRRGSDVAAFLETYTRPAERFVLVAHDDAQTMRPYLHQVFGDDRTMDSLTELRQCLSGFQTVPSRRIGAVEQWVTDLIAPSRPRPPIRPDEVDVLVLVGQKSERGGAVTWTEPGLDALKRRLSRVSRFRRDGRDLEVWEKP